MLEKSAVGLPLSNNLFIFKVTNFFGRLTFQRRKFATSRAQLTKAIDYYNRGVVKSSAGHKRKAIADYNRAIALDPRFVDAYINRGNAKAELGRLQSAIADYDLALTLDRQDAHAYYNRGSAKYKLDRQADAMVDFERAGQLDPQFTLQVVRSLLNIG